MRTALLTLSVAEDEQFRHALEAEGVMQEGRCSNGVKFEQLVARMKQFQQRSVESKSACSALLARAVPDALALGLRQWAGAERAEHVLCLSCEDEQLLEVPWELLPDALEIPNVVVARLAGPGVQPTLRAAARLPMLIAGWSWLPGLQMPGIARELTELPNRLWDPRLEFSVLSEPTWAQLLEGLSRVKPSLLHLAAPAVDKARLPFLGRDGELDWHTAEELSTALEQCEGLGLVLVNGCESGPFLARQLSAHLGVISLGWGGMVSDTVAADFALFFYHRLLEGSGVTDSVRAFMRLFPPGGTLSESPISPIIWLPSMNAVDWVPFAPLPRAVPSEEVLEGTREPCGRRGILLSARVEGPRAGDVIGASTPAALQARGGPGLRVHLEFEPVSVINPALLKNGRPALERLSIEVSEAVESLRLEILCDTGSGSSTYRETLELRKGGQPISIEKIHFPILYELIQKRAERRYINFVVTASLRDTVLTEVTRPVLWMGHNEWMDKEDIWPFIPSFVQPECEGVHTVFDKAVEVLKSIGSPKDSFSGYRSGIPETVSLQVRAIFQTLRDEPFGINYITPPAGPLFISGCRTPAGQLVRMPDELVKHRRGTCHDLALLFAACTEHVSLRPLILLTPLHTFFGFWRSELAHGRFWARTRSDSMHMKRGFGADWTLYSAVDVEALFKDRSIELLEVTRVTDPGATYEEACAQGARNLEAFSTDGFDVAVDVYASRYLIQPV